MDAISESNQNMILKSVFTFKCPPDRLGRSYNLLMPEALDVTCPCCEAVLKVDPDTGAVVWSERKKGPAADFDELVTRVHSQRSVLDEKFARSMQQTKNAREILDKKFEEAKKRADADPNKKPPNPFDWD
jgi:hypothetical protein